MKNMFLLLFVASFVLLIPTVNGSETNVDQSLKHRTSVLSVASYPFKKIWEHKKKFAALTIITGYICMTHWVDKKFQSTYIDYIAISDKSAYSDEIGKITDRLACLASTWFSMPYQKTCVKDLINTHPNLFPKWKVRSEINSDSFTIYRVKN